MKTIYISGNIGGERLDHVTMKFGLAQKEIESQGFKAVNALGLLMDYKVEVEKPDAYTALRIRLKAMLECDAVLLLTDYTESEHSMVEWNIAQDCGIRVLIGTKDLEGRLK